MPICPTCSSNFIENGRCGVCETPVHGSPPAVGRPEPAPRPPVRAPREIPFTNADLAWDGANEETAKRLEEALKPRPEWGLGNDESNFQAEVRKRMEAILSAPRQTGKKQKGQTTVKKYGVVLPPDCYEAIKMLPGHTGQNIEKAIRWWVSVFGEGSKE